MLHPLLVLGISICAEVIATSALKLSNGLTRFLPTLVVIMGYITSFYLMARVLKVIDISIVYAIWCGAGIALMTVISIAFFKEPVTTAKMIGMLFIIAGVVVLSLARQGH